MKLRLTVAPRQGSDITHLDLEVYYRRPSSVGHTRGYLLAVRPVTISDGIVICPIMGCAQLVLEACKRLDSHRLQCLGFQVKREIEKRSGRYWDYLAGFLLGANLQLAASPPVQDASPDAAIDGFRVILN